MNNYDTRKLMRTKQALSLSKYLESLDLKLSFEIIFPKNRWPNIENEQSDEAMYYINQHHTVFQDYVFARKIYRTC